MGRLADAILNQNGGVGYSSYSAQPVLDLKYGGQFGWSNNFQQWVSTQAYVRRNLVAILLEPPKFFKYMPNSNVWVQALKSLVELHPTSIEGFSAGLEVEKDEHEFGGGGEFFQEYTNVKRARTEPTFNFTERYGMPIQTFLQNWIQYGIQDPDTKYALVGTLEGDYPPDMLADNYSMSCLFFEPDPTHRRVVKSWVTTNMWPTSTGEIIGKRNLNEAGEVSKLSIQFTGLSQTGLGTNIFAQQVLNKINITNANPYLRPSFITGFDPALDGTSEGYAYGTDRMSKEAIKLS